MERHICEKCKAQYRYESDFEEHKRVGCKAKSAKKKAKSFTEDPDAPAEQRPEKA